MIYYALLPSSKSYINIQREKNEIETEVQQLYQEKQIYRKYM